MSLSNSMHSESSNKEPPLPSDQAFIAVGSNIDPGQNIVAALNRLCGEVEVVASSTFYRTAPVERPGQPAFLNGVWLIRSEMASRGLKFDCLRPIEEALGRERGTDRHAARTLDLDLILHGERVIDERGLRLPDPDIIRRPFIAVPLLELKPGLRLPGDDLLLSERPVAAVFEGMEPVKPFTEKLRQMLRDNRAR